MGVKSPITLCTRLRRPFEFLKSVSTNSFRYVENNICSFSSSTKSVRLAYSAYDKAQPSFGSPVVIMHGLMGSRANWNSVSKAINNKLKRKIFAVDARNHGDSPHSPNMTYSDMVEDLRTFIEDIQLGRVSAVGHSMGGRAMMLLALKYPELVEKLVVVDMSPIGSRSNLSGVLEYVEAMQQVKFEEHMPLSAARKLADEKLASVVPLQEVRNFLLTNVTVAENGQVRWRVNLDAIVRNFNDIATFPSTEKTFEGPTYFIGGGNSDYLRREDEPEIKKIFPSAVFEYIPGAGHLVHADKPTEFVTAVCRFLAGQ